MFRASTAGAVDFGRQLDLRPFGTSIGLKVLVPGASQFAWGQRSRGAILGGSFAVALVAAIWAWGTWLGWGILSFAFMTHVTSAADALRQRSFPLHRRRIPFACVAGAIGLVLYLPTLAVASLVAWPGFEPAGSGSGYLVNCWAYQRAKPRQGQWIWMRIPRLGGPYAGRVIAASGQEVEWSGRAWRVDGRDQPLHSRLRFTASPQRCHFTVPADQVLVEPEDDGVTTPPLGPLVLVPAEQIVGRAWLQYYPVWERKLL